MRGKSCHQSHRFIIGQFALGQFQRGFLIILKVADQFTKRANLQWGLACQTSKQFWFRLNVCDCATPRSNQHLSTCQPGRFVILQSKRSFDLHNLFNPCRERIPRFQLTRQTGEIQMTMRVDKGRKNNRLSEIHTRLPIIRFHFVAMTYFPDFVAANLQRTILDDASFSSPDCSRSKNH